jgi:hypothetical protein
MIGFYSEDECVYWSVDSETSHAFAKLREAAIRFLMSVRSYVCMYGTTQLSRKCFYEILNLDILQNLFKKLNIIKI